MEKMICLSNAELEKINGGGLFDFIGNTWSTIYNTGRDFGRSVVRGVMS
ncbi:alcohol dehydrogenase [Holzapfeliella floricola]|nr:alcohol dehydrogenase [Holzapfeliella floricola]